MTEMTDERLAELRKIAGAATPGAWTADGLAGDLDSPECRVAEVGMWREVDAEHMAAFDPPTVLALLDAAQEHDGYRESLRVTGNALEEVVAERDELQRRLDAVEARHTPVTVRYGDAPDELACRACGTHYEYPVAWPCPTVKAARGEQR